MMSFNNLTFFVSFTGVYQLTKIKGITLSTYYSILRVIGKHKNLQLVNEHHLVHLKNYFNLLKGSFTYFHQILMAEMFGNTVSSFGRHQTCKLQWGQTFRMIGILRITEFDERIAMESNRHNTFLNIKFVDFILCVSILAGCTHRHHMLAWFSQWSEMNIIPQKRVSDPQGTEAMGSLLWNIM